MWKELLTIVIVSVVSVVALFVLTKLMGNKQISQMSMFDYVIGISIGSIAAEMATELEQPAYPLFAMVVYALIAFGISVWSSKSLSFRKLTTGKPILLLDNGVIYRDNMKKARLDLSDFLTLCRAAGYFDLADIRTAIFEHNGTVSFLPMAEKRPVQGEDIAVYPKQQSVATNVIMDGKLMDKNLESTGFSQVWLNARLRQQGFKSYRDVFLATLDNAGNFAAFPMVARGPEWEPFE